MSGGFKNDRRNEIEVVRKQRSCSKLLLNDLSHQFTPHHKDKGWCRCSYMTTSLIYFR